MRTTMTIAMLCWALCPAGLAQSLDRRAISSGGGTYTASGISIDYTMGLTFGHTQVQGSTMVTQGYQQHYLVAPTSCGAPSGLSVSQIQTNRATVSLTAVPGAFRYRVRYRPVGSSTWSSTYINAPATSKIISGLQAGTTYEWSARTQCGSSTGPNSAYTNGPGFTTLVPCDPAQNLWASNIATTTARINWDPYPGATNVRVKYKVLGSTTWTSRSVNAGQNLKNISSLLPATTYEYHVQITCPNGSVVVSGNQTFTTLGAPGRVGFEADFLSFRIYPNPTQGEFRIEPLTEFDGAADVRLTDMTGRALLSRTWAVAEEGAIELGTGLAKGTYILTIAADGQVWNERVVVTE